MILSASATIWAALVLGQTPTVIDRPLPDLYGEEHRLKSGSGAVIVVMIVDARRLRNLKSWERRLRERFDDLGYLRIADLAPDSDATYEQVAKKLLNRVPEEVSVLVDIERLWATELGLDTSIPNLLLFDPELKLRATFRGRMKQDLLAEVCERIEALSSPP